MNILAQSTTALTLDRESLARDIRALPSLPPVVLQLMDLLEQPDAGLDEFADTLRLDQALSVKVLQLANSPFYGLSGRILSVRDAIHVLGLRQLGTLVIAAVLTLQFEALHGRSLHMRAFWRHSIACAVAARQLALQRGWNDAAAFTAGLLHDVGRLVVDSHYPEEAAEIIAWADQQDISHSEAEYALTGIDHAELGHWVCEHWRFSPDICRAIADHHKPPADGPATLADVVHVADALAHALDIAGLDNEAVPPLSTTAWQRLGLVEPALLPLLSTIEEEFRHLETVLSPVKEAP